MRETKRCNSVPAISDPRTRCSRLALSRPVTAAASWEPKKTTNVTGTPQGTCHSLRNHCEMMVEKLRTRKSQRRSQKTDLSS